MMATVNKILKLICVCVYMTVCEHHVLTDLETVVSSNLFSLLITLLFMRASLLLAASWKKN